MTMIAEDLLHLSRSTCSMTTTSRVGVESANVGSMYYSFHQGTKISTSHPGGSVTVIRPFTVEVAPSEEEYLASSRISNAFELGMIPSQAVKNYLEFLVDELVWLQKNEADLSDSLKDDLYLLQQYLRIA